MRKILPIIFGVLVGILAIVLIASTSAHATATTVKRPNVPAESLSNNATGQCLAVSPSNIFMTTCDHDGGNQEVASNFQANQCNGGYVDNLTTCPFYENNPLNNTDNGDGIYDVYYYVNAQACLDASDTAGVLYEDSTCGANGYRWVVAPDGPGVFYVESIRETNLDRDSKWAFLCESGGVPIWSDGNIGSGQCAWSVDTTS